MQFKFVIEMHFGAICQSLMRLSPEGNYSLVPWLTLNKYSNLLAAQIEK